MVNIVIPYTTDKNLGREYNRICERIADDEWICILDHDVLFLTPDAIQIMTEYAKINPGCVLTCLTNRIHPSSPQLYQGVLNSDSDIKNHIAIAEKVKAHRYYVTRLDTTVSGFLMLFPKSVWNQVKFDETLQYLGVDSNWSTRIQQAGIPLLRMDALYCFHTYRIMTEQSDKSHLL